MHVVFAHVREQKAQNEQCYPMQGKRPAGTAEDSTGERTTPVMLLDTETCQFGASQTKMLEVLSALHKEHLCTCGRLEEWMTQMNGRHQKDSTTPSGSAAVLMIVCKLICCQSNGSLAHLTKQTNQMSILLHTKHGASTWWALWTQTGPSEVVTPVAARE